MLHFSWPSVLRFVLIPAVLLPVLAGQQCFSPPVNEPDPNVPPPSVEPQPRVRLQTTLGNIVLELYPQQAPLAVANFLEYVEDGYYEGTIFHDVLEDAAAAGGVYLQNLSPKPARDPVANESNNGLTNRRGTVAVLETRGTDSGTSGFVINLTDNPQNDYDLQTGKRGLTVFGEVVGGIEVVDAIAAIPTSIRRATDGTTLANVPTQTVTITRATVTDSTDVGTNRPPTANAGPDQTVRVGGPVVLDAFASNDPDGDSITYLWRQTAGPSVTLNDPSSVRPSFTPSAEAVLIFELTVTDTQATTGTDSVTVTVSASANQPPIANAGADQIVQVGSVVTLNGSATDADGAVGLAFFWQQTGGSIVTLSSATAASPTFTAPITSGTLTFLLTVTDPAGASATDTTQVAVNAPPVANAGSNRNVAAGLTARLRGSATDPDAIDTLLYAWQQTGGPPVTLSNATSAQPTFTVPATTEPLAFQLTVQDGKGGTSTSNVVLAPVTAPKVRLKTSKGDILLDVLTGEAPVTAQNFLQYVDDGFYDGTIIHRVVPSFVVQGGGYLPGLIAQQGLRAPIVNEFSPSRSNIRATVAMAKVGGNPNSATSQFFFNLGDNSANLDAQNGGFTVFARVTQGMEVVDAMAAVATTSKNAPSGQPFDDVPVEDIVVTSATIE